MAPRNVRRFLNDLSLQQPLLSTEHPTDAGAVVQERVRVATTENVRHGATQHEGPRISEESPNALDDVLTREHGGVHDAQVDMQNVTEDPVLQNSLG